MRVELYGVTKRFGVHSVFEDVSATIDFEHALALIGPSGGGKSTLLRLLAGLIAPDSGFIRIDGEPLPVDENSLRAYRSKLGIVFQSFNLFPHLSALENVRLPLTQVHGLSESKATSLALEVLERFQLSAHAQKRPAALSGGQRQRVAIARTVAIQPRMLLLDEPTSALDPEMTSEVLDLIADLRREGRPLILVTHEMGFARHTADQVAFVSAGRLLEIQPPEGFFVRPMHPDAQRFLQRILRY